MSSTFLSCYICVEFNFKENLANNQELNSYTLNSAASSTTDLNSIKTSHVYLHESCARDQ